MSDQLPDKLDVIAVGAHPDDIEIAVGGTLARLVEQGHRVGIIHLTDGEPTPLSASPEVRLVEARKAADALGVQKLVILELPNRRLFDSFEARIALATEFRRYKPRLILGLGEKTTMASPDHWQAMQITDAAVFYSRLTKWDDKFAGLPPHRIDAQLYFSLASFAGTRPDGPGHIVVDVTETLGKKIAAVRCYESQFPPAKAHMFERLESQAHFIGQAAGYEAGELLTSPKLLGTRDLMSAVLGGVPAIREETAKV